jgi:hypothetical protein
MQRGLVIVGRLLIGIAGFVIGAAHAQFHAEPLTDASATFNLDGYSVQAPPGTGWFELKRDSHNVLFGKRIASRTHALIATAMSTTLTHTYTQPQDFAGYVEGLLKEQHSARYAQLETHVEVDPTLGSMCVRYYTMGSDTGAVHAEGRALLSETHGISCLHPQRPDLAIDLSYTERGYAVEMDMSLRAEGERFLSGLAFLKP